MEFGLASLHDLIWPRTPALTNVTAWDGARGLGATGQVAGAQPIGLRITQKTKALSERAGFFRGARAVTWLTKTSLRAGERC